MKIKGSQDTIDWYNSNANYYSQASEAAFNIHDKEQLTQFIGLMQKNAKVLDAGCGSGRDTNTLQKGGLIASGLDLSSGLISIAREKYPEIEFVEGNMLDLPFADETFDGIWAHASLLHLETLADVRQALGEFNRVLISGGIVHMLVKAQTGKAKTAIVSDSVSNHERFFQYFTKPEVGNLLEKSGFEIILINQFREDERNPKGRKEVEWVLALARKN